MYSIIWHAVFIYLVNYTMCNTYQLMSYLVASALATRLVLAGVSGSTFFINNHVTIAIMYIFDVGQINEHSDSDIVSS